jgi:hypothetical protein
LLSDFGTQEPISARRAQFGFADPKSETQGRKGNLVIQIWKEKAELGGTQGMSK